jgi:hypothetical protein
VRWRLYITRWKPQQREIRERSPSGFRNNLPIKYAVKNPAG